MGNATTVNNTAIAGVVKRKPNTLSLILNLGCSLEFEFTSRFHLLVLVFSNFSY